MAGSRASSTRGNIAEAVAGFFFCHSANVVRRCVLTARAPVRTLRPRRPRLAATQRRRIALLTDLDEKQIGAIVDTGRTEAVLAAAIDNTADVDAILQEGANLFSHRRRRREAHDLNIFFFFSLFSRRPVAELEARHGEVLALERAVLEVAELFADLATLVDAQGRSLEHIGRNIDSAKANVTAGHAALASAEKSQRALRRKRCCLCACTAAILAVVVLAAALPTRFL